MKSYKNVYYENKNDELLRYYHTYLPIYLSLNPPGLHRSMQSMQITYRRAAGSPLTLFTRTLALGQRTLQKQGEKS